MELKRIDAAVIAAMSLAMGAVLLLPNLLDLILGGHSPGTGLGMSAKDWEFLACLAVVGVLARFSERNERLLFTADAILYRSPLTQFTDRFDWRLPYREIRQVRLERASPGGASHMLRVALVTAGRTRRLGLCNWAATVDGRRCPTPRLPWQRTTLEQVLEVSGLARALREHGLPLTPEVSRRQPLGYDISADRFGGPVAVLVILLLGYAFIDSFIACGPRYAEAPPWGLMLAGGAVGALLVHLGCRWRAMPRFEQAGLPLFFGAALAAALYPGLLRIDAFTAREPWVSHLYRTEPTGLVPEEPQLPLLDLVDDYPPGLFSPPAFLREEGGTLTVELRRGGLGILTFDLCAVRERLREEAGRRGR